MAKQAGPIFFTGRIGPILFYQMNGNYYARSLTSLDAKRLKKDPAFKQTMQYAGWLGMASRVASSLYQRIPKEQRRHSFYRALTGKAMQLLKQGKTAAEAFDTLLPEVMPVTAQAVKATAKQVTTGTTVQRTGPCFADEVLQSLFTQPLPIIESRTQSFIDSSPP